MVLLKIIGAIVFIIFLLVLAIGAIGEVYEEKYMKAGDNITRFDGSSSVKRKIEPSADDYVGKITALFLPYVSDQISERDFSAVQFKLKKIVSDMKKGYAK